MVGGTAQNRSTCHTKRPSRHHGPAAQPNNPLMRCFAKQCANDECLCPMGIIEGSCGPLYTSTLTVRVPLTTGVTLAVAGGTTQWRAVPSGAERCAQIQRKYV